ncbi:MAG: hypothetical protein CSA62_09025 [Planctomycetota bacterium]|nr:MAG: hypothetical protein CSA62_09025 [Planctomycetota bacterium]
MIREWILRYVDINVPPTVMTFFFLLLFCGGLWFAFTPRRRALNERMARLPLEDDEGNIEAPGTKQEEER